MTFFMFIARMLHIMYVALRATAGILVVGHGIRQFVITHKA